jgi:hypothetical protein
VLLIAGELLRGVRIGTRATIAAAVVTAAAVAGGISLMSDEYSERWKPSSEYLRASLSAVEIARDRIDPAFVVSFPPSQTASAKTYLAAVDDYGSPAYSEDELAEKPDDVRSAADVTLAQALGLTLGSSNATGGKLDCQTLAATSTGRTGLTLFSGDFKLTNDSATGIVVRLGRFSGELPVQLGYFVSGSEVSLEIPADSSSRPWELGLAGDGPVELCSTAPA